MRENKIAESTLTKLDKLHLSGINHHAVYDLKAVDKHQTSTSIAFCGRVSMKRAEKNWIDASYFNVQRHRALNGVWACRNSATAERSPWQPSP